MKKNNRTIKEDILIIARGIKEFDRILPMQMAFLVAKSVVAALTPYAAVMMSALILNELTGTQNRTKLWAYILISIGATLLLSCVRFRLEAKIAVGYSRLFSTHEVILTEKAYRIPFFLLEKERVRSLREQVSGSIDLTGGGMASLYWDVEVAVTNLCSAAIALALGLRLVRQAADGVRGGMVGGGTVAVILLLSTVLIAGSSYITCKIASKRFDVSYDVFEQGAKYNRYGEFYDLSCLPDEDMAMDIRIFRQKELILRESQQKCFSILARGKIREMQAVSRLDVVKILCAGVCGAAVYAMVGFLAIRGVIGVGDVLMMYSAVTMLIAALSELAQITTDLRNNNVHLLNYFAYMDLEEERERTQSRARETAETEGTVEAERAAETVEVKGAAETKRAAETEETAEVKGAAETEEIAETEGAVESGNAGASTEGEKRYGILFEKVSFHYPESERMVLREIDLRIAPGEKLAIAGENGSGKTTLIKLLCRLYQPTEGRILLNGEDISRFSYEEYIQRIATVFQDFSLFAFPIAENVAASKEYDGRRVYEALCRAGLRKKVDSLSKGIRQAVSHDYEEDGMELSRGEAQKTAIARAIYKAAPIVILDEPTAALDPYAEEEIYRQFFENLAGETMLSISHRLSSCRFCDRIAVLQDGRLVQQGTHEELLRQPDGKYAELWGMQAQYYCEGDERLLFRR